MNLVSFEDHSLRCVAVMVPCSILSCMAKMMTVAEYVQCDVGLSRMRPHMNLHISP